MSKLYRLTDTEQRIVLGFKRDLHMHPELSRQEFQTTEKIRTFLQHLPGFEILDLPVPTGVLARIRGTLPGPETLLRADIDALPQTEQYESPWKSQTPGVMHACGHDFHTASLLGCALLLTRALQDGMLRGTTDLLFQPAEEGTTGALAFVEAGLFDQVHPDRCFGMHNWPSAEAGSIVVHEGPVMAAKRSFKAFLYGAGGHGSMPHLNIDPIVCAAAVVQSLQTIVSRNTDPLDSVVVSVHLIQGGGPANVVADKVELRATIRSLSDKALDRAAERAECIINMTAKAYECTAGIEWEPRIPAVLNTPEMCRFARTAAARALETFPERARADGPEAAGMEGSSPEADSRGQGVIDLPPSLVSEDFAVYREHVPSFFYWVGSGTPGEPAEDLHRPCFHTDDSAISLASAVYFESAQL